MKYIKLFEAFESNILSKTLAYLSDQSKKDFMKFIKSFCDKIDFPLSKLSDEYFQYLPYNKALKMVISSEDKVEDCKATSKEIFGDKGADDICTGGKLERKWGKGTRKVACPKCIGTGKIKVGDADAPNGYELIKFWIDDKKDIVALTLTDGKKSKTSNIGGYETFGKIFKGRDHNQLRSNIQHLQKIFIEWDSRYDRSPYLATFYKDDYSCFAIHDNGNKNGGTPYNSGWNKYGRYSWDLSGGDYKQIQMCKIASNDGEIDYYHYNKITNSNFKDTGESSSNQSLESSQFAIVFDTGKLKKSEYIKKTEISKGRLDTKSGVIGGKIGITNDDIKKQNLDKYIKALATKNIKGDVSDLTSLDNYIFRILGGKNLIFKMLKGETGDVVKVIEGFFKMLKVNEGYNDYDDDKIKEFYRDKVVIFMNTPEGDKFRNDINKQYVDLQTERGMSEYDTLEYLYRKYVKGLSVDNSVDDNDKTTGIKNTLITLFDKSIRENQMISNEIKKSTSELLRVVLDVSEHIYNKLKSFGKVETLIDVELLQQKIISINNVLNNDRWYFSKFIKGKKSPKDFSGTYPNKKTKDEYLEKLKVGAEEIKKIIDRI